MPVAEFDDVAIGYRARTVLAHVRWTIAGGEFWFLIGANGAGKTSLVRTLLGDLAPVRGSVRLGASGSRVGVGFVPQRCEVGRTLPITVGGFVGLGLVGVRCSQRERRERLDWALEHSGLGGMARRDYWALSGGQRQRALVARALVRRPTFLIADEPTAGLDLAAVDALLDGLRRLNREQGLTVLVVTHDLHKAARYGARFALCVDGTLVAGAAEDVLQPDTLRRAYGVEVDAGRVTLPANPAPVSSDGEPT